MEGKMKEWKDMKIAVAGMGYVGLSISVLLAQQHKVFAVDILRSKVDMVNILKNIWQKKDWI